MNSTHRKLIIYDDSHYVKIPIRHNQTFTLDDFGLSFEAVIHDETLQIHLLSSHCFASHQTTMLLTRQDSVSLSNGCWMIYTNQLHEYAYGLIEGEVWIGRDASNQIVFNHQGVSKRHCRIYSVDNHWIVEDLNSLNGTYVNQHRIHQQQLKIGDCIEFCGEELWFMTRFVKCTSPKNMTLRPLEDLKKEETMIGTFQVSTMPLKPQLTLSNYTMPSFSLVHEMGLLYVWFRFYGNTTYVMVMAYMALFRVLESVLNVVWHGLHVLLKKLQYRHRLAVYGRQLQTCLPPLPVQLERYQGLGGLAYPKLHHVVRLAMTKNQVVTYDFDSHPHLVIVGQPEAILNYVMLIVSQLLMVDPYLALTMDFFHPYFWFAARCCVEAQRNLAIHSGTPCKATYQIECVQDKSQVFGTYDGYLDLNEATLDSKKVTLETDVDPYAIFKIYEKRARLASSNQMMSYVKLLNLDEQPLYILRQRYDIIHQLTGVIGYNSSSTLTLDLHEQQDGPHLLVAGMTGSGKSEWLLSYLLSLCVYYDSEDVQFFFIDFKGGGLAKSLERLHHTVMVLTNLDDYQMERAICALEDEIVQREKQLQHYQCKDIHHYKQYCRQDEKASNMAHLLIIVDEFAELKQQNPEALTSLIRIARIGRSLGIHLILATQRPSGIVDGQIQANIKAVVSLKVASSQDSYELLHQDVTKQLIEPGAFAFRKDGASELVFGQSLMVKTQGRQILLYNEHHHHITSIPLTKPSQSIDLDMINRMTKSTQPLYFKDFPTVTLSSGLGYIDDFKHRQMLVWQHSMPQDGPILIVGMPEKKVEALAKLLHCPIIKEGMSNLLTSLEKAIYVERVDGLVRTSFLERFSVSLFASSSIYEHYHLRQCHFQVDVTNDEYILVKGSTTFRCKLMNEHFINADK